MSQPVIVVHYHELWLKGRNKRFFVSKLAGALRAGLEGIPVEKIERPEDRFVVRLAEGAGVEEALARIEKISGVANYAIARNAERNLESLCHAAWEEIHEQRFETFAVRVKRSDKTFPMRSGELEAAMGKYLADHLRETGRSARVKLNEPELTCRIEITSGPALVYARKIQGPGGLPANTAGRMLCLLSGGFDSAVAAHQMMKRGAHLSFAHFYGTGARPGESSVHVARELTRQLVPWQFTAKLHLIPFEAIQREIVRYAPESCRVLLYRRMMLRIAEALARRDRALAIVTGDSLGQVASQTLRNMIAVEAAARMPVFRPLVGMDKLEILSQARKIGTYEISAEPFHDCCPVFLPRSPLLHASAEELDLAEAMLNVDELVKQGIAGATHESYRYACGRVEIAPRAGQLEEKVKRNAAIA
ncbi:MAG TPA: tRNA uracil 4-sulfurtransferase ThiI [Candidatus Acidoferrales bacterium]|nr:tRNA uracil 4-sulfurtransferase ThiI [Candidatus Acidoferrales bacterium]